MPLALCGYLSAARDVVKTPATNVSILLTKPCRDCETTPKCVVVSGRKDLGIEAHTTELTRVRWMESCAAVLHWNGLALGAQAQMDHSRLSVVGSVVCPGTTECLHALIARGDYCLPR